VAPESLRGYQRRWLTGDLVAGVTLAAVAFPETMGYTSIAQTPVVTGLYTVIFPTVVFALLGSSRLRWVRTRRRRRSWLPDSLSSGSPAFLVERAA
jgi:MFS superfamily sulfate permease-like transporter